MDMFRMVNDYYANLIGVVLNAIIIITTLIIGAFELKSMKKARHAEVLNQISIDVHNAEASKERDAFFRINLKDFETVTYNDRIIVECVIEKYNMISYFCCKKMIPQKYLFELYSGLVIKLFEHSKNYILGKQNSSGLKNYAIYLNIMYNKCLKYRKKRRLGTMLNLVKGKQYDLVKS